MALPISQSKRRIMAIQEKTGTKSKKKFSSDAGQTKGVNKDRKGNYILMYSGSRFWPLDPHPEDITIEDIAHSLSRQCRFTGHTKGQIYSVGNHSILCANEAHKRY